MATCEFKIESCGNDQRARTASLSFFAYKQNSLFILSPLLGHFFASSYRIPVCKDGTMGAILPTEH